MLNRLYIENFAIIRTLELELSDGFFALTGETGAGKSIIIDALNLAMGGRADKESIASGADKARVEAVFKVDARLERALTALGFAPENGEVILSREVSSSGRSVCRCNGALVTQAVLREVSDLLVDIHGQHEHQSLLNSGKHLAFVDAYGAKAIAPLKEAVAKTAAEWRETYNAMRGDVGDEAERMRRMDMLSYQIAEISAARLQPEEEADLLSERERLRHHERIESALTAVYDELYENEISAHTILRQAVNDMDGIRGLDESYDALLQRIEEVYYTVEDIAHEVRGARLEEFDPRRRDAVEERLDTIDTLKRKYGQSVKAVLDYLENAAQEQEQLATYEEKQALYNERDRRLRERYALEAQALSGARVAEAEKLCAGTLAHMAELGLGKSRFEVQFRKKDADPTANGWDDAEFLLTTNEGEPLKPLSKVASGGEMSRIMLSLKTVASSSDETPTLIFDEIDTGISGQTALFVGEKLRRLSRGHQVLCVTHQAQIAALADAQCRIEKMEQDGKTIVTVQKLDKNERILELVRMMGGESDSESAKKLATELMARAQQ